MIKNKLSVVYDDYKLLPTNDLPPNEIPFLFKQNSKVQKIILSDVDLIKDGLDVIYKWLVSNYKEGGFHDKQ